MTEIIRRDCFGNMFPDDLHLRVNQPNQGKIFTVLLSGLEGGVIHRRTDRSIKVDLDEWDDCQSCPEFDSCYKLCLAKATLESAITNQ